MKHPTRISWAMVGACLGIGTAVHAGTLYSENFESNPSGNWVVLSSAGVNGADFFFDYSSVGIPVAPSGTGTHGLKLQANLNPHSIAGSAYPPGGIFGGLTVSPVGQSFSGNYTLAFDWWGNYQGPLNGSGSGTTQVSQFGVGTAATSTQWIGTSAKDGVSFAATLDGGSEFDYRAYSSAAPSSYNFFLTPGADVYAAPSGSQNNVDSYYTDRFAGASAPGDQIVLFPGQTGVTPAGVPAFRWNPVEITKQGDTVQWFINGSLYATVDLDAATTLAGGNILFGHSDTNAGASIDATHRDLLFTLIDNVRVLDATTVPIPAAAVLLGSGLASLLSLGLRRRRRDA